MQNKANLPDTQMNATCVKAKNYEQNTMEEEPTKQTQSKPIFSTSAAMAEASQKFKLISL
jgi:hypothetical protein